MEIVHAYQRKRSDFGRMCHFSDTMPELIIDLSPQKELQDNFVISSHPSAGVQVSAEKSEHEVNTEVVEYVSRGINHVEGGWPKDVDASEAEQTIRYRKKTEKEEEYIQAVVSLGKTMEHVVKQNNALDIYEEYFADDATQALLNAPTNETPTAKTVQLFRDPHAKETSVSRSATHVSWQPDGARRIAVSYSVLDFQKAPSDLSLDSHLWNIERPIAPEMTITPSSALLSLEYNPKDGNILAGGCYNGSVAFWDTRKGSHAVEASPIEKSHRDPVHRVAWNNSKTGTEFFSTSTDGMVLWWDTRKLSEPTDSLVLDVGKTGRLMGGVTLEFESTMPTKFMVGCEQGTVVACNRKAKSASERIVGAYGGHHGPVYAVARNTFFPKHFLSVGDWTARVWNEDLRTPIMSTRYHQAYLTDGCWSPVRPAVFFTSKMDGTVDVWDYLVRQSEPALTVSVSDVAVQSLSVVPDTGRLLACGGADGTVTMVELGGALVVAGATEKQTVGALFDRETKREKLMEARTKEMRLKQREGGSGGAGGTDESPAETTEGMEKRKNDVACAEAKFWELVKGEEESLVVDASVMEAPVHIDETGMQ